MQFIHISDLHFHRHEADNEKTTSLLKIIGERYPSHYLIVTGDIVDDGDEEQYDKAFEALKPFKGRAFISPGNHDFGAVGCFYEPNKAELFDERLTKPLGQPGTFKGKNRPVVTLVKDDEDQALLIALDTNLETDSPFDFACGEIGHRQLSTLDVILGNPENANLIKFLFFHHHPFMRDDPFMELKDAGRLWPIIYKRLEVLLFGHKHVSQLWENKGGVKYILASDNSPGKDYAREISVVRKEIKVQDVSVA